MGLEKAIVRGFRHEVTPRVGESDRQFPGRQFRLVQRQFDDLIARLVRDTVFTIICASYIPHFGVACTPRRRQADGRSYRAAHISSRLDHDRQACFGSRSRQPAGNPTVFAVKKFTEIKFPYALLPTRMQPIFAKYRSCLSNFVSAVRRSLRSSSFKIDQWLYYAENVVEFSCDRLLWRSS